MKLACVGAGNVGATAAQAALVGKIDEIVLVDIVAGVPQGKALDMMQSAGLVGGSGRAWGTNDYAEIAGADVVIVTALFCSIRTVPLAYLLKGMFVIFGTVFMAHFSISELSQGPHPLMDWVLKSTLSDILILWVGFFIGKAIYDSYTLAPA